MTTVECTDCGETVSAAAPTRCPDCGGTLEAAVDLASVDLDREILAGREGGWRHGELLPIVPSGVGDGAGGVAMGEGGTPLVDAPRLADELGVARVLLKDEGRNPTGSVADRGMALVASAAARAGADALALASTGADGRSAAAYAGRAGLRSRVFVPSRAPFVAKAMINVHGGDMRVVEGRFDDARAAYEADRAELPAADREEWYPAGPAATPFRIAGVKPVYYELAEQLGWRAPDALVVPVGHGETAAGLWRAAEEFATLGLLDRTPSVYAAQPEGCAPVVRGLERDHRVEPWETPDTVAGELEVPDPDAGDQAAAAVRESRGRGVAVSDDDLLDSAATVAQHEGLEVSVAGGAAAAGAWALAGDGAFGADDVVVLLNPGDGGTDADVVRSRLMGRGM